MNNISQEDAYNLLLEAMAVGADRAIENQEKRGQAQVVHAEMLPRDMRGITRSQLEGIGFIFGANIDDMFIEATLPAGWQKQPTGHSMWSKILDDRGRERFSIFYKAAFYDRSAFLSPVNRFSVTAEPINGWADGGGEGAAYVGRVFDCGTQIWQSLPTPPMPAYSVERDVLMAWYEQQDTVREHARAWLCAQYPDYNNPLAYWETPSQSD